MYTQNQKLQEQGWPESAEKWLIEWAMSLDQWLNTPEGMAWLATQAEMHEEQYNSQPWEDRAADLEGWQS